MASSGKCQQKDAVYAQPGPGGGGGSPGAATSVDSTAPAATPERWGGNLSAQVEQEFREAAQQANSNAPFVAEADDVRFTLNPRVNASASPSATLGNALTRAGGEAPFPGHEVHHIVPEGDERAEDLREFLLERGIYINDAVNAVPLPRGVGTPNPDAVERHDFTLRGYESTLPDAYFEALEAILFKDLDATPEQVRETLQEIRDLLERGRFT